MDIREALKNFPQQFEYEPRIENEARLRPAQRFIVVGMGGSHLPAGILKTWNPNLKLLIHRNYGLPKVPEEILRESLIILSSYSGNTEEVWDAFDQAIKKELNMAVISTDGKLLEQARSKNIPYIRLPDNGIPSRLALGLSVRAHLKLLGDEQALSDLSSLVATLDTTACKARGKELSQKILGKIPVIYGSHRNRYLAYNFKVNFNETAKIPAFSNLFPELNHNEMEGFTGAGDQFHFIFLQDADDDPRIQRRMELTKKLYGERGLPVEVVASEGDSFWQKIFNSVLTAAWAAFNLAELRGTDADQSLLVEEFKERLRRLS